MKVAFYMTTTLEGGGGCEKYLIETAKRLSEITDVHIDVFTMDNRITQKIINLLNIYNVGKQKLSFQEREASDDIKLRLGNAQYQKISSFKKLREKFKEYDVVYSKNELLEAFILKFMIGYKNIPPVVFIGVTPLYYPIPQSLHAKLHNMLYGGFIYKFLASGIKAFHAKNSTDEKILNKLFPRKKVVKLFNSINVEESKNKAKKYQYPLQTDKTKYNILWAGRLTEQKGIENLIDIIEAVNSDPSLRDRIIWNIAGEGEEKYKILITLLKKRWENVRFHGHIPNIYMPSVYQTNSLLICTSKWESFGLILIEANAMNVPVISYNISGPNEVIGNGKTGFLVSDTAEFVTRIKEMIHGKHDFGEISVDTRLRFNDDQHSKELLNLLKYAIR